MTCVLPRLLLHEIKREWRSRESGGREGREGGREWREGVEGGRASEGSAPLRLVHEQREEEEGASVHGEGVGRVAKGKEDLRRVR